MKTTLVTMILAFLTTSVFGQYNFQYFDSEDGLLNNHVNGIVRDREGYLWVGSSNGLTRWDGYYARNYQPTAAGLPNDDVYEIGYDQSGNLWVKSYGALSVYDRESDALSSKISTVLKGYNIPDSISNLWVGHDGTFWALKHDGSTLYSYNADRKELSKINVDPKNKISQVVSNGDLAFCVLTDGGIMSIRNGSVTSFIKPENLKAEKAFLDSMKRLWVISNDAKKLSCIDAVTGKEIKDDVSPLYNRDRVKDMEEDGNGNLWIATNSEGIFILSPDFERIQHLVHDDSSTQALPGNHTTSLFRDSMGIMWVGLSKNGVAFTPTVNGAFEMVNVPIKEDLVCFREDNKGNLWIGSDGKGLLRYSPGMNKPIHYTPQNSDIPSSLVIGSCLDKDGTLIFGTYGGGVVKFKDERFEPLHIPANVKKEELNYVRHIVKTSDGSLWLGTFQHGIYRVLPDGQMKVYNNKNSSLRANCITGLANQGDSVVFIGTSTGVFKIPLRIDKVVGVDEKELGSVQAKCILSDSRGLVWIGTNQGLIVYDGKSSRIWRLTKANNLSHQGIKSLIEDKKGDIWVATNNGLTQISVSKSEDGWGFNCVPFFKNEGFGNVDFHNYAIGMNKNGEILVGSTGSFVKIQPQKLNSTLRDHKILFTGLKIDNVEILPGEKYNGGIVLPNNVTDLKEISLPSNVNSLCIQVSAMDFINRFKIRYEWTLDGEKWHTAENGEIRIENLEPGMHELTVRSVSPNSVAPATKSLTIRVSRPFLKSFAVYGIVPLFCIILIGVLFYKKRKEKGSSKSEELTLPDMGVEEEESSQTQLMRRIEEVCMKRAFDVDFSVEDLAQELGMSRSGLYKKLMGFTGKSPLEYLRHFRIEKGKQLLEKTNMTVSEIAYQAGLSPKQFSRYFKQIYGSLPSDYRAGLKDKSK